MATLTRGSLLFLLMLVIALPASGAERTRHDHRNRQGSHRRGRSRGGHHHYREKHRCSHPDRVDGGGRIPRPVHSARHLPDHGGAGRLQDGRCRQHPGDWSGRPSRWTSDLEVGQVSDQVTVMAETPLLESSIPKSVSAPRRRKSTRGRSSLTTARGSCRRSSSTPCRAPRAAASRVPSTAASPTAMRF